MSDSEGHQRAQSELIGFVLLFALVIAVSLTVVVAGGTLLSDARADTTTESAQLSMTEFQSAASSIASEEAASERITFAQQSGTSSANEVVSGSDASAKSGNSGDVTVDRGAGQISITVKDASDGTGPTNVLSEELGIIYYQNDGQKVAYQGGGVFRQNTGNDGSSMVSPPDFQYQYKNGNPTLRIPLTTVEQASGDGGSYEDGITLQKASPALQPSEPTDIPNRLENGDWIEITVTSEYYRAWGEMFEERTGGTVTYPGTNTVKLRLEAPTVQGPVQGPVLATGPSVDLRNQINVDSYDSSTPGGYSGASAGDATVYADGSITIQGGGRINGDLQAGGDVTINGNNNRGPAGNQNWGGVTGTVYHGGTLTADSSTYGSAVGHTTSMPTVQNRDGMIFDKIEAIKANNDNGDPGVTADISALERGGCASGPSCELTAGDYHLEKLMVSGNGNGGKLVLDTNGGDINIAVKDRMRVNSTAEIEVVGDGTVNIYNAGDFTIGSNKDTKIWNTGDDAPQLWAWQSTNTTTDIGTAATFTGVVHAGPSGKIEIGTNHKGDIYGAIIGDVGTAGAGRPIHFDRALRTANPFGGTSSDDSTISYVQVDLTGVTVSD